MKTSDKIIDKIKREGAITAKQIAESFGITSMGARQHLQGLEDDGIVEFYDQKVKVGRPTRHWKLTEKGHQQFADRHSELAIQVIDAVEELFGEAGLTQVANQREQQTLQRYLPLFSNIDDLETRVAELAKLRSAEGYMAEYQATHDGFLLIENHCPICKAATRCEALCQSELSIFQTLLGDNVSVSRTEHIVQSQRRCCYQITQNQ
ncbi:helix-turn-helix transcriptional regulator [Vibrio maerlii]|uniref:helix-turn-helix transcriptional regulator n=1 Tax=Vibrio maerlii TaxID=2231648 RepID=UPI000E3E2B77|nr:metalloregulator ArsR/SmtB family transcription factor [Vibrio maerlii]